MKRVAVLLLLCAAACKRTREAGLEVTVEIPSGAASRCLQVVARHGTGSELRSTAVRVRGGSVGVGVVQGALPSEISLHAEGFADEACAVAANPPERSKDVTARFEAGAVGTVTLTLIAGSATRETACANGADDDGDGDPDCADPDCDGLPCFAGGTCAMRACRSASTEKSLCADGADNDSDGAADCMDSDCIDEPCATSDLCVTGARCTAAKTCGGGSPKVCTTPPGPCFAGAGACAPTTGQCSYPPLDAGVACDDGDACTSLDTCDGAGACAPGATVSCTAPPLCFTATGATCNPVRGCEYPVAMGLGCDDGISCTGSDVCRADGGCSGTPAVCVPTECQSFGGQCGADAGCIFTNQAPGSACDAGVCNGGGACIPSFPYPPANFVESQVPTPPSGEVLLDCGTSVIDTGVSGAPTFSNWCGEPLPGVATLSQPGGADAVLLSFTRLTVAVNGGLRVTGARPAIIAALGDVTLAGPVEVLAGASDCADGGFGLSGEEGLTNGGGGGGSFATAGGRGGTGSPTLGTNGSGGDPGLVNGSPALVPLRGGCPGALGARSGAPRRAAGGGALQISAAGALVISAAVTAPGQGGPLANNGTGGNGAGSGGALALEAVQLTMSPPAALTAHGGGGGEGGGPLVNGNAGSPGTADGGAAPGGDDGALTGGAGGTGATQAQAAGSGADGTAGSGNGGGGGGGLGRIRLRASVSCSIGPSVVVSPAFPADGGC